MSQLSKIRALRQKAVQQELNRAIPAALFNDDVTEKSFTNISTVEETQSEDGSEITRTSKYNVVRLPARPNLDAVSDHVSSSLADDFGLVVVGNTAHVWRYTSPEPHPETYTHSLPVEDQAIGHLIPVTPSFKDVGHPGLVLIGTNTGECVFWESVGVASEGYLRTRQQVRTQIKLYSGEVVEHVTRMDNVTLVLSLSSGRLVGLSLRDRDEAALNHWTLRDTKAGLLSNIRSAFSVSANRRGITGVRVAQTDNRGWKLYVATAEGHLGVWQVAEGGDATLTADKDLKPMLSADVNTLYNTQSIYLHDIEYIPEEEYLVVLTSVQVDSAIFYMVYTIDLTNDSVVSRHRVQSYVRPGLSRGTPRLARPAPGDTLYIILDHAVVLIDTVTRSNLNFVEFGKWEDSILLKKEVSILGFGVEDQNRSRDSAILCITDSSGVLKITRFPEEDSKEQTRSVSTLERGICKSRIEQGVFFETSKTPLQFSATGEYDVKFSDEVVCGALLQVSHEICSSTSPHLEGYSPGLSSSLEYRRERLLVLAEYAEDNFSNQIDMNTRMTLVTHAEKLTACEAIWDGFNEKNGYLALEKIIGQKFGCEGSSESDLVTDFFTSRVLEAADLIFSVYSFIHMPTMTDPVSCGIMGSIRGVQKARQSTLAALKTPQNAVSAACPWWCETQMMETWDSFFRLLTSEEDLLPLASLAEGLCNQSVLVITWARVNGDDFRGYENTYYQKRGDWIRTIVRLGLVSEAIVICEEFHLYRCLAEILDHDLQSAIASGNLENVSDAEYALRKKLNDYGYDFAKELYAWWIESRDFESLFTRLQDFRPLLKQFFRSGNHANISWILSLGLKEYQGAAEALVQAAREGQETFQGPQLRNRLIQLSMAKLSFIQAGSQSREVSDVNSELSLGLIQKRLFEHVIQHVSGSQIFIEQILTSNIPPGVYTVAKKLVSKLVQNKVLTTLELIELCTCVPGFFGLALQAISYSNSAKTNIMCTTVWIRALLSTDWSEALKRGERTDDEQEKLLLDTPLFQLLEEAFSTGLIGQQNSPLQVPEFDKLHKPNSATLASTERYQTNLDADLLGEFDHAQEVLHKGSTMKSIVGLVSRARIDALGRD